MKKHPSLLTWFKKAFTHIWRFLLGILLTIIGVILLTLTALVAGVFYLVTLHQKRQNIGEILQERGYFYKLVAIGIDILGNIIGGSLFNWLFLKEVSKFPFGIPGEKISSVLEWNFRINNLSKTGFQLWTFLNWLEEDHGKKSVAEDIERANFLINNT